MKDIFVPAKYTLDAATGDVVAVEVKQRPPPASGHAAEPAGSAGPRGRGPGAADAAVRRHLFRVGGFGLRADRRQALRPADLCRRSRGQERPAGRQSGHGNDPLPLARARRRRRDHRGPGAAGQAGRRYALDHPRVQPARGVRRGRFKRGPAGGGPLRRVDRRPARSDRRDDHHDRSGGRPRFRRRHFPGEAR